MQTTPLASRSGRLLGMMPWREPYEPTPSEIRTLDILARQAADLIERLQAEARLNADLPALTRMHELSCRIVEPGKLQPLLQEVMEARAGTLHLLEGNSLRIAAHCGHLQPTR